MDAKLTLKLDKYVIDKAKEYASSHQRSLSRLIESYLKSLVDDSSDESNNDAEITPFVKSMSTGVNVPSDLDFKTLYRNHLIEKYK